MDDAVILNKLEEIIRELFDDYSGPVTPALSARDVERWDSLGHIQLMVMVEKVFGIRFDLDEVRKLPNLGELITMIRTRIDA